MVEHCDRCGTKLHEDEHRHQQFRVENAVDSEETLTGRLCSDCFWEFEDWLEKREVTE